MKKTLLALSGWMFLTACDLSPEMDGDGLYSHTSRPSVSPDGRWLLFSARYGGRHQIFLRTMDGSTVVQLTTEGNNYQPFFSPDGSKIVFASYRGGENDGEIYVVNTDGTQETRLTDNSFDDTAPSFAPNGKEVVFTRATRYVSNCSGSGWFDEGIHVVGLDQGEDKALTGQNFCCYATPYFSADGQQVVFNAHNSLNGVIMVRYPAGEETVLVPGTGHFLADPVFSSDREHLVYVDRRGVGQEKYSIRAVHLESEEEKVLVVSDSYLSVPLFAPGGKSLTFLREGGRTGGAVSIWMVDADGTNLHEILPGFP